MTSRPWRGDVVVVDEWMSHYRVKWRGATYDVSVNDIAEESDIWDKERGQKARLVLPRDAARELNLCR